ncbi:uncharacterized protein SAZU_3811 [Streptomyces azureus]|uniref:YD repeat-containing protein n=2 Tax=Streptomyces azureus TaxID=146537 RepID=A0A0K8PM55_STRAJ|nr:uncharacterized protein SAZU_3811 [Streptomyces azureus]
MTVPAALPGAPVRGDQLGNLAKMPGPAPASGAAAPGATFTCDLLGERLPATDPTGARTGATYDDLGRQVTSTVIEGRPAQGASTTTLSYDGAGNLLATKSPAGLTTSGTYNAAVPRSPPRTPRAA